MKKRNNEFIHHFFANLPLMSFFVIIIFIYSVYMTTYLGKLLSNSYDYDKQTEFSDERLSTIFLTMRTITDYTDSMVGKLQTHEIGLTEQEQKGAIYFAISHIILLILCISAFRTIFTAPGAVPLEWSLATESELYAFAEIEKKILIDNYRRKKEEGFLFKSEADEETTKLQVQEVVEPGIIQGGQGEDLVRKLEQFPDDLQMIEQLNQMSFINAMKKHNRRFCSHCQMFKPERTHHCRQCNVCVLKMDHHCPWVGNCVGFRNYKFFINMVFYGVLMQYFVIATYTEPVCDTIFNSRVETWLVFLIFFTYVFTIMLSAVITAFFFFHCWLIIRGRTTLEFVEEKKTGDYNFSLWINLKSALGSNFWVWFLPFNPTFETNGLQFRSRAKFTADDD